MCELLCSEMKVWEWRVETSFWEEFAGKWAAVSLQGVMEGWGGDHDGGLFAQWLSVPHWLNRLQALPSDFVGFMNDFIDPADISGAALPAEQRKRHSQADFLLNFSVW